MTIHLPLCIDLDGTLIQTDVLQEMLAAYVKRWPHKIFLVLWWWIQGRAYLKQQLARYVALQIDKLPYNDQLVTWLQQQKTEGQTIILVTASDFVPAKHIADHVGIFDDVMASNGRINLRAQAKADALVKRFGHQGFIYAGNSKDDLKVWHQSAEIIAVDTPISVLKKAQAMNKPLIVFDKNHK